MRSRMLVLSALVALVAACGGQASSTAGPLPTSTPGTRPQATSNLPVETPNQPVETPNGQPGATVNGATGSSIAHLEVGGGPMKGTYDATSPKVDCNISATGSGATYLDLNQTTGISSMTFSSVQGGPRVTQFYFNAAFGGISLSQPTVEIDALDPTSTKGGHGTAQLEDKGATIKWDLDGVTADGTTVKASIECSPVDRR